MLGRAGPFLLKALVKERLVTPHGATVLIRASFLDWLPGPIDDWRTVAVYAPVIEGPEIPQEFC